MQLETFVEKIRIAKEPAAEVYSWKAYGGGILLHQETKLYALSKGRKTMLVPSLRLDDEKRCREWSYYPYDNGAILREFSWAPDHEGTRCNERETITAYADDGTFTNLYRSGEYFDGPLSWAPWREGIITAEHPSLQPNNVPRQPCHFYYIDEHKNRQPIAESECDEWRAYGDGIALRKGTEFSLINKDGGEELLGTLHGFGEWKGYGRGIIVSKNKEVDKRVGDVRAKIQSLFLNCAFTNPCAGQDIKPTSSGFLTRQGTCFIIYHDNDMEETLEARIFNSFDVYSGKTYDKIIVQETEISGKDEYKVWSLLTPR